MLWSETSKYEPTEKEQAAIAKFVAKHNRKHSDIPVGFVIKLYPSGIGVGVGIRCLVCKKKKDVTDFDSW